MLQRGADVTVAVRMLGVRPPRAFPDHAGTPAGKQRKRKDSEGKSDEGAHEKDSAST